MESILEQNNNKDIEVLRYYGNGGNMSTLDIESYTLIYNFQYNMESSFQKGSVFCTKGNRHQ